MVSMKRSSQEKFLKLNKLPDLFSASFCHRCPGERRGSYLRTFWLCGLLEAGHAKHGKDSVGENSTCRSLWDVVQWNSHKFRVVV